MQYISLGDHCAAALLLKELLLRDSAYPFDWIAHIDELNGNLTRIIIDAIEHICEGGSIDYLVREFLPLKEQCLYKKNPVFAIKNSIKFPHDKLQILEYYDLEFQKYSRRFRRLAKRLHVCSPSCYVIVSKRYCPSIYEIDFFNYTLAWQKKSRVIVITGNKYAEEIIKGKVCVRVVEYRKDIRDFNEYTGEDFRKHDLSYWRKQVKESLISIINDFAS